MFSQVREYVWLTIGLLSQLDFDAETVVDVVNEQIGGMAEITDDWVPVEEDMAEEEGNDSSTGDVNEDARLQLEVQALRKRVDLLENAQLTSNETADIERAVARIAVSQADEEEQDDKDPETLHHRGHLFPLAIFYIRLADTEGHSMRFRVKPSTYLTKPMHRFRDAVQERNRASIHMTATFKTLEVHRYSTVGSVSLFGEIGSN